MGNFIRLNAIAFPLAWQDIIDILFMTVVIYKLYTWFHGTRAFKAFLGLMALGLFYLIALTFGLFLTSRVFQILWQVFVILIIVLFQSEIREVLEKVNPIKFLGGRRSLFHISSIHMVVESLFQLSRENLGALIVLERRDRVDPLMKEGVLLEGEVSQEILTSIFQKTSPVHDGAVILREGRLSRVGAYLPLTEREGLPKHFGTRHRAAIGLSERCDAIAVLVSEENHSVSLAQKGEIEPFANQETLKEVLEKEIGIRERSKKKTSVRLQEWLTHRWKTKVIALAITVLAWIVFVSREPVDLGLTAPLNYRNVPNGLHIKSGAPEGVFIKVEGPRNQIRSLKSGDVSVIIDLSGATEGDNPIEISRGSVESPFGTRISLIRPSKISVFLDKVQ